MTTDPNLTDVAAEICRLQKACDDYYWINPDADTAPQSRELSRMRGLLADGVIYEPKF